MHPITQYHLQYQINQHHHQDRHSPYLQQRTPEDHIPELSAHQYISTAQKAPLLQGEPLCPIAGASETEQHTQESNSLTPI